MKFSHLSAFYQRIVRRVPTYLHDLKENPSWLWMFVLARTAPMRRLHWLFAKYPTKSPVVESKFFGRFPAQAVDALKSDGIYLGLVIPAAALEDIKASLSATPCFGNFDRGLEFLPDQHKEAETKFGTCILSGHYFERSLKSPVIEQIQNDAVLQSIAKSYLGDNARVITTRIWWSFPTKADQAMLSIASQEKYHFDIDDWRMLKFFFYLTDVDEGSGPHKYVKGSHRHRALVHQLTPVVGRPTDEVLRSYGETNELTVLGPPGFGFVEDPFGFHMGTVAQDRPRLMMEVGFGISEPSKRRFHGEPIMHA